MCECAVDMEETSKEDMPLSTSVNMEMRDASDEIARPPYHHVSDVSDDGQGVTSRPSSSESDIASSDNRPVSDAVNEQWRRVNEEATASSSMSPRQTEQRQRARSTTKCQMIPIVVSGQSTARLGQLCYEMAAAAAAAAADSPQ